MMEEMRVYLPELYAEINDLIDDIYNSKGIESPELDELMRLRHLDFLDQLRLDDPEDMMKKEKYDLLEKKRYDVIRCKASFNSTNDEDGKKRRAMDSLIRMLDRKSRRISMEVLNTYESILDRLLIYYPVEDRY